MARPHGVLTEGEQLLQLSGRMDVLGRWRLMDYFLPLPRRRRAIRAVRKPFPHLALRNGLFCMRLQWVGLEELTWNLYILQCFTAF